jgi:hypothetical protein
MSQPRMKPAGIDKPTIQFLGLFIIPNSKEDIKMAKIFGINGKVMYGSVVVAEQVSWSMSGFSQPVTSAPTAFGDTGTKVYEIAELGEAGTIEFSGNYDPTDTTSQAVLLTVCKAGSHLTNLYLYANTSTFWRVGAGGYIIVTKAAAITMPRNNVGTISFSGQVSSQAMEQVGTGS